MQVILPKILQEMQILIFPSELPLFQVANPKVHRLKKQAIVCESSEKNGSPFGRE